MIPWWTTDFSQSHTAAIETAFRNRTIVSGCVTREFEHELAEILGVAHVVLTTSGTAALFLALRAVGVGPGDDVILPAHGFVAPAHAALMAGGSVRLADVMPDRPLLNPAAVAPVITDRTKAVVAIHLNGMAADIPGLRRAIGSRPIAIVEDCAQAFLSRGPDGLLGSNADIASYSLGITKLVTMGEGGFVATNNAELAEFARRFRNHGVARIGTDHFDRPGFNLRATDFAAALGRAVLADRDERAAAVRRVYDEYAKGLQDHPTVRMMPADLEAGELPLWPQVMCDNRDGVVAALAAADIQARPLHRCLAESPHLESPGQYPNAERFSREGLILPGGTHFPNVCDVTEHLHRLEVSS
jgi:dTDP-4-amino-4,6-dideoxygalactose transaminase